MTRAAFPICIDFSTCFIAEPVADADCGMLHQRQQRSRLVLAAAMWSKPHLLALDEPTNYLDNDTLAALTHALKSFKHGGVIVISHNVKFVNALVSMHARTHALQLVKT